MTLELTQLQRAVAQLQRGQVVACATESFFGLLVDAGDERAIDLLFEVKGRDAGHGVALMAPNTQAWLQLVQQPPALALRLAERLWPGPLTLCQDARTGLDARLMVGSTVGVRVPGLCDAAQVVQSFGRPVTATSANLAGEPPCATSEQVRRAFVRFVASEQLLVVPGEAPGGEVSTLVRVSQSGFEVLRPGAVPSTALEEIAAE